MASHEDETTAATAESGAGARFRPPRRRRKPLLVVGAVTVAVVVYLIYLMARGPDAERTAERLVESTLAALPDGPLAEADVRAVADGLHRALGLHATSEPAREADGLVQRRVAQQVEADTLQGNLERAGAATATHTKVNLQGFWANLSRIEVKRGRHGCS